CPAVSAPMTQSSCQLLRHLPAAAAWKKAGRKGSSSGRYFNAVARTGNRAALWRTNRPANFQPNTLQLKLIQTRRLPERRSARPFSFHS
ncbi:hypothetical protein M513_12833, partial [Trichuris suis]